MSVREIRLCDHPECNGPAGMTCPLCERDCCRQHADGRWIMWAILAGTERTREGTAETNCIGSSKRLSICNPCHASLTIRAVATGHHIGHLVLNDVIPPIEKLTTAAKATIAAQKLTES